MTKKPSIILHVQYVRALAVCLVVLHHAWQIIPLYGHGDLGQGFPAGACGVDLFFVISGFIMVTITQNRETDPGEFILRRLARVGPMYWIMTSAMAATILVAPSVFRSARFDLVHYLTSMTFVAWPHPTLPEASPVLQVGWTLNYEFMFYVSFAFAMAFSHKWRSLISGAFLVALVGCGLVVGRHGPIWNFYTSPILTEFVMGMAIGQLATSQVRFNRNLMWLALLAGFVLLAMTIPHSSGREDPFRALVWGAPSALVILGAVGTEMSGGRIKLPLLERLGDASYVIYLTHLFALGAERALWGKLHLGRFSDLVLLAVGLAVSLIVGWMAHIWVEEPIRNALNGLFRRRKQAARSAPA